MSVIVRFIKDHPKAQLPSYGTAEAAGADIRSVEDVVVPALGRVLVPTGLKCVIPVGYELQVRPRSGLALKHGIGVLNSPGTVDSDYTGPVNVILYNTTDVPFEVQVGDRIAQIVVAPVQQAQFEFTDEARATDRGEGGFGSTGAK